MCCLPFGLFLPLVAAAGLNFVTNWIQSHADDANSLNKPFVVRALSSGNSTNLQCLALLRCSLPTGRHAYRTILIRQQQQQLNCTRFSACCRSRSLARQHLDPSERSPLYAAAYGAYQQALSNDTNLKGIAFWQWQYTSQFDGAASDPGYAVCETPASLAAFMLLSFTQCVALLCTVPSLLLLLRCLYSWGLAPEALLPD